ncbi:MAG: hypothetical protein FJW37_05770 [Acidobacteria bacterium]|nr:hypothetical protein [Acidobacteriota bacterium]
MIALAALLLAAPIDIGSRLELFVDDFLIESLEGVRLVLHPPRPAGKAIAFDQPWEGNTSAYVTVFKDDDRYRMYYRGSAESSYIPRSAVRPGGPLPGAHPEFACYAESRDGIAWTKPSLGLVEFDGSKQNNIIWGEKSISHNFAPFRDRNPAAPPAERYKALAGGRSAGGLVAFRSADGIHWSRMREKPVLADGAFDSLNVAFWDSPRGLYVAIYRDFRHGVRTIKFATSKDFLNWSAGEWADFGAAPLEHLYTNATSPYFRAPHIFLAFPKRFVPWRTVHEDASSPGISETVFMASRDGLHWRRRLEAFIRPGRDERDWIHRNNMVAAGVVPTAADELSLYCSRHYNYPTAYLERMTLRTDGFISAQAGFAGGELRTKPLTFEASSLVLNYATSAAGSLQVELEDVHGNPLPGLALADQKPLFGDRIEHALKIDKRLSGIPVRLRFVLKDADLYSFQFRP